MQNFICKVRTPQGQVIKIKLKEENKIACLKKLKRNGMTPIEVKPSLVISRSTSRKISASIAAKKREEKIINLDKQVVKTISREDIKEFTKELLYLRQAKFSNEHAIKTIIQNTNNQNFKNVLKDILKNVEKNLYIYKAMEAYAQIFPSIYVNLIKNGELTGLLNQGLKNALVYLENEEKLTDIMQEKVFPNILALFITILVMFLSVVLGIPLIERLLFNINITFELPLITRIVLKVCDLIVYKWYSFVILIVLVAVGIFLKLRTPEGKLKLDNFKYKNKLYGKMLYLIDFSRIIRCITINFENKMRLQDSLEVCKNIINNKYMINTIEKSINGIFKGNLWIEPFEEDKILNPITIEMIKECSNQKSTKIVSKTIEYIEYQIDREVEKLTVRLSEIFYIILGILFLMYVVTVLIPCISVYLSSFLLF